MKKGVKLLCLGLTGILLLSGCGTMQDLTEEQEKLVSEYSVALLLKYDAENHSRLVNTESFLNRYYTAKQVYEEGKAAYYAQKEAEEAQRRAEAEAMEAANEPSEESSGIEEPDDKGTGGATVIDNRSIESFLGLDGFSIVYGGFDLLDSYPEDSTDYFFSMDATPGKKLLITYFNVENTRDSENKLNIFGIAPSIKMSVNQEGYKSIYASMLEDDLSMFSGSFSPNERKRLVLVYEVKKDTVVDTIDISLTLNGENLKKNLR